MKNILLTILCALFVLQTSVTTAATNFVSAGTMSNFRLEHTATLLPNGKVLVVAGSMAPFVSYWSSVELFNPTNGLWRYTGPLSAPRIRHTATLLNNGKVLIAGGDAQNFPSSPSAELYNPASETWTNTGSLGVGRELHTATLLPSGKVLVVGGDASGASLTSAELYDPASGTWTNTGSMNAARYQHTATLLPNGKVLVIGGIDSNFNGPNGPGYPLSSAELYDPQTEQWTFTYPMSTNRYGHSATLLPNGKVLVAGGSFSGGGSASCEIYDPASEQWAATASMNADRQWHKAVLLSGGKVLVVGGSARDENGLTTNFFSAELYDSAFGIWTDAGEVATARGYGHTATALPNGRALVVGGLNGTSAQASAELYDPAASGVVPVPPTLGITSYSNLPAVFFPTRFGASFSLQMTTNLAGDDWVNVTDGIPISGVIITNPPSNAFFRLQY